MVELTYWPKRFLIHFVAFVVRTYMYAISRRKKRAVPSIKNKLLLKTAIQLAKEIREGKLKSEEVVLAYISRIQEVEPYINAVVQDNFDEATKEARRVDAFIQSGKFSIDQLSEEKPLLGVPFTVKCLIKVKGFQNTGGSVIFKDRIADTDAPPVAQMKEAGGIFLALTNSPEFGSTNETRNKIYGKTSNPYDITKTCGGSSGGEAALISAAGSVIGVGNDVFGSVRMPAHNCGIFGHKPSRDLILNEGIYFEMPAVVKTYHSVGPMCRYSDDLFIMMKVMMQNRNQIDLEKKVDFRNVKIYYQTSVDNAWVFNTEKEIVEAVHTAASYFKVKYGSEVNEIKIPLLNKTNTIILNSLNGRIPSLIGMATGGKVNHLNGIIELIKMLFGKCQFTFSTIISSCFGKWPMFYNKNLIPQCDKYMEELDEEFDKLLDENSLFFFPTLPKTAPYHREAYIQIPTCSNFVSAFNFLGLPATHCPMGFNDKGLPLGVQIISRRGNDVLTLLAAAELEKSYGGWIPPP